MNAVTDMLRCQHPIILGAMGVICNPELVAAVSEAGGYGLLATAFVQDVDLTLGWGSGHAKRLTLHNKWPKNRPF